MDAMADEQPWSDATPTSHHVMRLKEGQPDGFTALYARISPSLAAWARLRVSRSLRDFVEPEDVVQEVWWRAMFSFHRFDPEVQTFRPWLFRIATHVLLEWNRQREQRERLSSEEFEARLKGLPLAVVDQGTSVSERMRTSDTVQQVVNLVQALSPKDRLTFCACGLEGLTAAEAAAITSETPEAVNKRWQRLRARLSDHPVWSEINPD